MMDLNSVRSMRKWAVVASICLRAVDAHAGDVFLPSDVSVSVTATPTSNLQPEQPVVFTISVANNGPVPLVGFGISSSDLYPEQIDLYGATTDCGVVVTGVADTSFGYYYDLTWYPTDSSYTTFNDLPLAVGETRTCHFTLYLGPAPPPSFALDFHLGTLWDDPNPSNNVSRVRLQLVPQVEAAPVLSAAARVWLAFAMLVAGLLAVRATGSTVTPIQPPPRCNAPRPRNRSSNPCPASP